MILPWHKLWAVQEPTMFLIIGGCRAGVRSTTAKFAPNSNTFVFMRIFIFFMNCWHLQFLFKGWHLPKATDLDTYCIKEFVLLTGINRTNKKKFLKSAYLWYCIACSQVSLRSKSLQTKFSTQTSRTVNIEESPNTATKSIYFLIAKGILHYRITIATHDFKFFMELLSPYSKCSIFNISSNNVNSFERLVLLWSQFYRWGMEETENLSNLPVIVNFMDQPGWVMVPRCVIIPSVSVRVFWGVVNI